MVHIFQPSSKIYVLGGPNISKYQDPWETNNFRGVHIFQLTCEIYVPGGPNISEYKDRGGTILGGSKFFMTASFPSSHAPEHEH